MKTIGLWLGLAGLLTLTACTKNAGTIITEDRTVGAFSGVEVSSAANVIITDDPGYEVRIEAGDNLMPYIKTKVNNSGVLSIWESNNFIWHHRSVTVYISATYLNKVVISGSGDFNASSLHANDLDAKISGSGNIEINDLTADNVEATISGSGNINLSGDTYRIDANISGSGDIDTRYLLAKIADVTISGSGDIKVYASQALYAKISGSGDIQYWGNPSNVNTNVSGSGTIVKR